jgi:NAD(P)-dependent dehydrogenase (short-subunit alcohol dehydrogenase family)
VTAPLTGQHAVVTGAGRGIGAAIADALAGRGANVTLMGRDRGRLDAQAARAAQGRGVETAAVPCDVTDPAAVAEAFRVARETFGPPHILVNNAGQSAAAALADTPLELWHRLLAVNLTGAFLCMQQVLPAMLEAGRGRIVNVASVSGLKAYRKVAAYTASKHGLIGLTRAAAAECAQTGVTVNAVCPAYTDTDMAQAAVANLVQAGRTREEAERMILRAVPRGSLITPGEVAAAVGWLCSPEASAVNGQSIVIAGGEP